MANAFCNACSPCQEQNDIATIIMQELEQMRHVDDLIAYIDELINKIGTGSRYQGQVLKPDTVSTSIDSASNLTVKLSKSPNWHVHKKCLLSSLDRQTRKVVIEALKQGKHTQCVGIGLSIIVHLWERAEQASSNKDDCVDLLGYVSALAKHMNNNNLEQPKLNNVLCFILNATVTCALVMKSNRLCRFISAPMDYDDVQKLKSQLLLLHSDLKFELLNQILNRLPTSLGPSQGEYPGYAVGIDEAKQKVIELLNLEHPSPPRAVVIYGLGGIGKTTLVRAVFSRLDLSSYHYCRVCMDNNFPENNLPSQQSQILRVLFKKNLNFHNCTEGQEKLMEAFREASQPLFLFIENALRKTDLEKLLPVEHLPKLSRILITTRNLNEIDIFGGHKDIQVFSHRVDSLSEPEAARLLCHYANRSFDPAVNMDGLLQFCGGIPLVLKTVAHDLCRLGNTESAFKETLRYYNEWQQQGFQGTEDGREPMVKRIVDFVYTQLREPSQQAFLDIAAFFYDWEQSKVRDIVGERQLKDIEEAALVTISQERKVKMHNIVRARGRWLSEGKRITDKESLCSLLEDNDVQKIQQIKGIWIPNDDNELSLEAKQLDLMSKTLRVLSLGKNVKLRGRCNRAFEELRFLHISYADILSIDPRKSRQLAFFGAQVNYKSNHILHLPESLRLLYLDGGRGSSVCLNNDANLTSLRELELISIDIQNFENSIHEYFSCLKMLKLENKILHGLPENFGNLFSLQTLNMHSCSSLKTLPESFGNLSSLQTLNMDSCRDLERLPESFGNLSSLQTLSMVDCEKMCILSDNFGQLKCLKHLSIRNCKKLNRLPDDILMSTTLVAIKAYGCVELEAKAMDSLVEITSLMFLEMGESPMLIKRWEEIHRHRPPIAAVLRFESGNYPYGEIMSTMFFSARSTFLQIDGDGQLAEVALSEVGVKVGLLLTACPPSDELRRTIKEVASKGFQIIYVHVGREGNTEEEREKRIREILVQLPEGSRAWTSPFNKAKLLFSYSLWEATGRVDACVVGTSVVVDEEGRRKLSHPFEMIFKIGSWDSRVELRTLFSPLSEAMEWMLSRPWEISAVSRLPEIGITDEGSEWNSAQRKAKSAYQAAD